MDVLFPWSLFSLRFDWIFLWPAAVASIKPQTQPTQRAWLPTPNSCSSSLACFDILLLSQCLFIFDAAIKLHCNGSTTATTTTAPTLLYPNLTHQTPAPPHRVGPFVWLSICQFGCHSGPLLSKDSMREIKLALSPAVFAFQPRFDSIWCPFVCHFLRLYVFYIPLIFFVLFPILFSPSMLWCGGCSRFHWGNIIFLLNAISNFRTFV